MILKLLLVMAVIYVVYTLFFKAKKPQKRQKQHTKEEENKQTNLEANELVPCVHCGTYVEIEEAILSNGKYYCSSECVTEAA